MSRDMQRLADYMEHILEALERIESYDYTVVLLVAGYHGVRQEILW